MVKSKWWEFDNLSVCWQALILIIIMIMMISEEMLTTYPSADKHSSASNRRNLSRWVRWFCPRFCKMDIYPCENVPDIITDIYPCENVTDIIMDIYQCENVCARWFLLPRGFYFWFQSFYKLWIEEILQKFCLNFFTPVNMNVTDIGKLWGPWVFKIYSLIS